MIAHWRIWSRIFQAAAHDARGPLHAMALHAELLRASLSSDPSPEEDSRRGRSVAAIEGEIRKLDRMLDALLGPLELSDGVGRFDLRETIDRIGALLGPYNRRNRMELHTRLPDRPVEVDGNPDAVRYAVLDVVLHALNGLPEGSALELSLLAGERLAVLSIADRTSSRSEDRLPSSPHSSAPDFGSEPAVARFLMERHGGRIRIPSETQSGHTIEIELPLAARHE